LQRRGSQGLAESDVVKPESDDGYGNGYGDGNGNGFNKEADAARILTEIGVPSELQKLFLPLSEESMLHAAAYAAATTQEYQDRIIGLLELI